MTQPGPPALVAGLSPTGLAVARELDRAGVAVLGMGRGCAAASRHVKWTVRGWDDVPDGAIVIPTSDQDIAALAALPDAARLTVSAAYLDGRAARLMDKARLHDLCVAAGLAVPPSVTGTPEVLARARDGIPLPCIVKPARIERVKARMGGRKGWVARTSEDLARLFPSLPDQAETYVAQRIVPGPESDITLFAAHVTGGGDIRQAFTARKLRQYPAGFGSASLAQSVDDPETRAAAVRLLEVANYAGIAAVEFKRDAETGILTVIEANPRPSLWFGLTSAAGRPVTTSAWCEAAGRTLPPETPQVAGIRWRHVGKDLASALHYRLNPGFVLAAPRVGPAPGPVVHAVFDPRDPSPALAEARDLATKALRRLRGRPG